MEQTEGRADGAERPDGADGVPGPRAAEPGAGGAGGPARSVGGGPVDPATASPMAVVMADMPGVWRRLLEAHVPDRLGRCRGCRSDTGSGERWPCSLHQIATEARRLHEHNLEQAIDSDTA
ncbi:MAG TPA: hypothetical protein VF667_13180 [Pseudonocardia sp.]